MRILPKKYGLRKFSKTVMNISTKKNLEMNPLFLLDIKRREIWEKDCHLARDKISYF